MSIEEIAFEAEEKFEKALSALEHDFRRIRTGRASVAMVEHVHVEAYGASMPILQVAGITVPEPTQLLIKPYDKGTVKDVERALINADLGMSPQSDGEVLRLNVPPLSSERRQQLVGQAKEFAEKSKVALRHIRRDTIKHIEQYGKEEKLSEDEIKKSAEDITEVMKQYEVRVEKLLDDKSSDLAEI